MYYTYSVPLLVLFCILMHDLSRKEFGYVTILKLIIVCFVFFVIEHIKNYSPSWGILAAICCIILAPWLVVGDLFRKKKRKNSK